MLDRATRRHGRVSVDLDDAEFPIGGPTKREAKVEGAVVFEEVELLPGPFADQLLNLLGRTDRPTIKLDEPVALTIADRRVYQKGLAIPLGQLTRVELDGWVDFDRNIQLTASLPLTAAMVGNAPILSALVQDQRISVPIRGTLKTPQVDRDAFNDSLRSLGQSVLGNGMTRGAIEMFKQLQKPRDPTAPRLRRFKNGGPIDWRKPNAARKRGLGPEPHPVSVELQHGRGVVPDFAENGKARRQCLRCLIPRNSNAVRCRSARLQSSGQENPTVGELRSEAVAVGRDDGPDLRDPRGVLAAPGGPPQGSRHRRPGTRLDLRNLGSRLVRDAPGGGSNWSIG